MFNKKQYWNAVKHLNYYVNSYYAKYGYKPYWQDIYYNSNPDKGSEGYYLVNHVWDIPSTKTVKLGECLFLGKSVQNVYNVIKMLCHFAKLNNVKSFSQLSKSDKSQSTARLAYTRLYHNLRCESAWDFENVCSWDYHMYHDKADCSYVYSTQKEYLVSYREMSAIQIANRRYNANLMRHCPIQYGFSGYMSVFGDNEYSL
jgi:hypothetical protein